MAEEETKKVETETLSEPPPPPPAPESAEVDLQDVAEEKSVIPPSPPTEEKPAESTELAAVESTNLSSSLFTLFYFSFKFDFWCSIMAEPAESTEEKSTEGSVNRGNYSILL